RGAPTKDFEQPGPRRPRGRPRGPPSRLPRPNETPHTRNTSMQSDAGITPDPGRNPPPAGGAAPPAARPGPGRGLPPVAPPSGRFILQLFLVPGLIVAALVVVALGLDWLFGGHRKPEKLLKNLDDPNPEVRWRAAADLSQILPRDDELAA